MANLNSNYGSELHLLRMLERHRDYFDRIILESTGANRVEWLDFPSGELARDKKGRVKWDCEWEHLNFLDVSSPARKFWEREWPMTGKGPNWDLVGRFHFGNSQEWLLLEAKANLEELFSTCGARGESRKSIQRVLDRTKANLGVPGTNDWLTPYYQLSNRLAVLDTMNRGEEPAHLIYVYFCGDVGDEGRSCPATKEKWIIALEAQEQHIGLPKTYPLNSRIHKVFVDVQCTGILM
jgi:hypothetical protein